MSNGPNPSPPLILIGRVSGAFGVKGEVRIKAFGSDPMALLDYRNLTREDGSAGLTLLSGRAHKSDFIGNAKEVATREEAEALRGLKLFVPRATLPEPDENEFYLADLIGLAVQAPDGAALGTIRSVQDFGAGDLLEIEPAERGATWWLPFTRESVPVVHIAQGFVVGVQPAETGEDDRDA